jgi:hypothetical protein
MASANAAWLSFPTNIRVNYTITPNQSNPNYVIPAEQYAVLLTVSTIDLSNNLPVAMFVYQVEPVNANNSDTGAFFTNVCSLNDYVELPVGVPVSSNVLMFRHDSLSVFCRSIEEADYTLEQIKKDIKSFIDSIKIVKNLPTFTGGVTYG